MSATSMRPSLAPRFNLIGTGKPASARLRIPKVLLLLFGLGKPPRKASHSRRPLLDLLPLPLEQLEGIEFIGCIWRK